MIADSVPQQHTHAPTSMQHSAVNNPTETEIRIYIDDLLIAKCHASGIAPGRLFVAIDPLNYPVNSRLSLGFVSLSNGNKQRSRLAATVVSRTIEGIELKLDA